MDRLSSPYKDSVRTLCHGSGKQSQRLRVGVDSRSIRRASLCRTCDGLLPCRRHGTWRVGLPWECPLRTPCRGTAGSGCPEAGARAVEVAMDLGQLGARDCLPSVSGLDQDLEQKLTLQEQDAAIVKNMRSELARLPTVERELRQLREENACLR